MKIEVTAGAVGNNPAIIKTAQKNFKGIVKAINKVDTFNIKATFREAGYSHGKIDKLSKRYAKAVLALEAIEEEIAVL